MSRECSSVPVTDFGSVAQRDEAAEIVHIEVMDKSALAGCGRMRLLALTTAWWVGRSSLAMRKPAANRIHHSNVVGLWVLLGNPKGNVCLFSFS